MAEQLSDRYSHKDVEQKIYQWWLDENHFASEDQSTKTPYAVVLPPPNVTGHLHIGHALNTTIQDCLVRWKRMCGFNAMWMPGADHAGIATQSVVEKNTWKEEGKSRHDIGREKFVEKIWAWKEQYGDRINGQLKALGLSLDWDRARFTLDEKSNAAVRKVFVQLYKDGLIYKGTRLVNWSPKLSSAISDLEVDHQDTKGSIWHIQYPIEGSDKTLSVATTRPETMLGDTAVAVHPEDERYNHLIGSMVLLPLTDRKIPVIADEYVEKDFGSGVVKITPAHDFNDYEVGKRHNLPMINILEKDGSLNQEAGKYQGLTVKDAREKVLEDLKAAGLLEKEEPHNLKTPLCSRTGCVVEPLLSEQWFVSMEKLAEPAKAVAQTETIKFEPENYTKIYLHWLNNIEDWCISRQLWWGHRIPVWECADCEKQTCTEELEPSSCEHCGSKNIKQDEDVLDTWFSSALWPFSTLGWPKDTEALKTFYPTDSLVTGHDILFFWVARMIMMGLYFQKDVPFRTVYLHGLVRDSQGRKMSKSLGNSIDPLEIIEENGADSLRFTLLQQVASGKDLKFSQQRLEGNRNFMNKIWNATRFVLNMSLENFEVPAEGVNAVANSDELSIADKWIIQKLKETTKNVNRALKQYRFSEAANLLYSFTWNDFCDWYLEFSKPVIYGEDSPQKKATQLVLAQVLNRIIRMLHPFIPHITEEIYQKLPMKSEACITAQYPSLKNDSIWLELASEEAANEMDIVRDTIVAIRNIRGENRISHSEKISVRLSPSNEALQTMLENNRSQILNLATVADLQIGEAGDLMKCAVSPIELEVGNIQVIVPLEGLVDFDEEIKRLNKNIEKTEKEINGISRKLGNENFVKNAPAEVVEKDKVQLGILKSQLGTLRESLSRLQ
ncbi:MAG: valine--tRNA ligase [Bdellovibrionaceae bacterium]|nr:valine--tRNA ligase [Pseudobdellovibrionaceae bacterium]|tara:strand:- start:12318 stop:15005 length:2688 start_codon:yes stop_codon:yes gene_type:complete